MKQQGLNEEAKRFEPWLWTFGFVCDLDLVVWCFAVVVSEQDQNQPIASQRTPLWV
jgi:hypothetical protein